MKILITAGPTREAIDPVRYISNRSSGKMGYAIAIAAAAAGHEVMLISGPVSLPAPEGVHVINIESAEQLLQAVTANLVSTDLAIFAAAVADYRPSTVALEKIKKTEGAMTLELERTPDVLGSVRSTGYKGGLVGFAAETNDLLAHAKAKLEKKGCDLIIANDVSQSGIGFDSDHNAVTLLFADGRVESFPKMEKSRLAEKLIGVCENLVK